MSAPFIGEVKMMSFNFPPKGWALCNGQFLPINQNQALFSLFGTTYGGNGQTTFALPDLRGRVPVHMGTGFTQGQSGGQENHTLTTQEMTQHIHFAMASNVQATTVAPGNGVNLMAQSKGGNIYSNPSALTPMAANSLSLTGGSQPHTNQQPYLVINFVVALQGIFPSQN